jgi:ribosomal protein S18 acetylase RimI-like enzyme
MEIRRAKRGDLKDIGELYADAYNSCGYKWSDKPAIDLMRKYYHTQNDLFFVVEDDEVGIVAAIWGNILTLNNEKYLDKVDVWVDPEYRGRGLAKNLMRHLFKRALRKYKVSFIRGLADSDKKYPREFYERFGFGDCTWINLTGDIKEVLKRLK